MVRFNQPVDRFEMNRSFPHRIFPLNFTSYNFYGIFQYIEISERYEHQMFSIHLASNVLTERRRKKKSLKSIATVYSFVCYCHKIVTRYIRYLRGRFNCHFTTQSKQLTTFYQYPFFPPSSSFTFSFSLFSIHSAFSSAH